MQAISRMCITHIREQDNIVTQVQHILANSESQESWGPSNEDEQADCGHDNCCS